MSDQTSCVLSNRAGSFLFLSGPTLSKFNGIFLNDDLTLFKTIESISPTGNSKGKLEFMEGTDCVRYSLKKKADISIDFDCRRVDDMRKFGRHYTVNQEKGMIIVEFTKKTDKKEDTTEGEEEFSLCIIIEPDLFDSDEDYDFIDKWKEVHYPYDKERSDPPTSRYVYRPFTIKAKELHIAAGKTKKEALSELKRSKSVAIEQKDLIKTSCNDKKTVKAFNCAQDSLNSLMTVHDRSTRIYAGYPWFFQMWSRDENISLGALIKKDSLETVKDILFVYLDNIGEDGRLPNRVPSSSLGSADGIGWFWKRMDNLITEMERQDILDRHMIPDDMRRVKEELARSIENIEKNYMKDCLIQNNLNETWMDTTWQGEDGREGACIEVQAMHLNMLRFMQTLCTEIKESEMYKKKEKDLKDAVLKRFWNKQTLADMADNFTIRPNIFIAYYIYPQLLEETDWKAAFESALEKLWLDWGGLSSIDTTSHLFTPDYTGRTNQSYHRGDSWYWLNNLAALCLHMNDKESFRKEIRKIIKASSEEILHRGAIGHHAEVSSASHLSSKGCFAQAWSAAMFIELIAEVYR
ncbi:amylo-alpha-1,6-glucosidase [Nanoarchaeota archaeon]